jgi:hypothetical protein
MTENTPETTENTLINQENTQNVNDVKVESPVINEQTTEKLTKLTKRQKIGGRKPKLTEKNIKEAIDGCLGNYSTIAQRLNVSRPAITQFFNKHPELKQLADNDEEKIKDIVQNHIHVALKNGEKDYIKWFADRKMKDRGFGEKVQVETNMQSDFWAELKKNRELMKKLPKEAIEAITNGSGVGV